MHYIKRTLLLAAVFFQGCKNEPDMKQVSFITLDPGHFHAALVQKSMYPGVDSVVHVYAPEGNDVASYLGMIEQFNSRAEAPTSWKEEVYKGPDYFEKMLAEKAGNVVVLAGNNGKKIDYISKSIAAGLNVLADKPMAITPEGFATLQNAFKTAAEKKVLLYDIMTERYEITSMLQRELSQLPGVFGTLQQGTAEEPAVIKESVHHFFKYVAGKPLVRPAWFFDVTQAGEGIVDVTTHLVDLIQWTCFPEVTLDYTKDIAIDSARRWPTKLTPAQFKLVTNTDAWPDYLQKDLQDSVLNVYANGEINYTLKNVHAKVAVMWNFQAPEGTGDTHYSLMRGTKANLLIRQGAEQQYKPVLYIQPHQPEDGESKAWQDELQQVLSKYPGVTVQKAAEGWEVIIPEKYKTGHEAHFGEVTKKYLRFLQEGSMPAWEVPNMIAKYYTTTEALRKAVTVQP
ncbi:putative oxidoreductase C-terminal domain-containing protein [Chitinophaga cymbidii]|uniref:Oxidoreductase n=1 Tax=Chitinophaga cymbidii TaxID=1096750 RepID=A0A512RE82_9BACT|nr:putative oxidoreductase C-terminal domain-containing protein [Chitinophaga cymbidii]GEP94003.1 oxidoreductase [Chitinophaga cymbidii]